MPRSELRKHLNLIDEPRVYNLALKPIINAQYTISYQGMAL